jgi:hypothetical protein
MDFREVDVGFIRLRVEQFVGFVMVLSVLIIKFKLRGARFLNETFRGVEFIESLDTIRAMIITAFINSDLFTIFPPKEGMVAIRAKEPRFFTFAKSFV